MLSQMATHELNLITVPTLRLRWTLWHVTKLTQPICQNTPGSSVPIRWIPAVIGGIGDVSLGKHTAPCENIYVGDGIGITPEQAVDTIEINSQSTSVAEGITRDVAISSLYQIQ